MDARGKYIFVKRYLPDKMFHLNTFSQYSIAEDEFGFYAFQMIILNILQKQKKLKEYRLSGIMTWSHFFMRTGIKLMRPLQK